MPDFDHPTIGAFPPGLHHNPGCSGQDRGAIVRLEVDTGVAPKCAPGAPVVTAVTAGVIINTAAVADPITTIVVASASVANIIA